MFNENTQSEPTAVLPKWAYIDKGKVNINEPAYAKIKAQELQCRTINGNVRTIDAITMSDAKLLHIIQSDISPYVTNNVAKRSKQLLEALKNSSFSELPKYDNRIHFANGTYDVNTRSFTSNKVWCNNRIMTNFNPNAPKPVKWLKFLEALLFPIDIITLQQYLGYCFIQSTALQQMLFLIGNGGEGKSVIGKVMTALLGGENVYTDKIHELQKNRFKLANLENKLLFIDDDLQTKALDDTGIFKTLISGGNSTLEKKGQSSYNAELYARGLCFGNTPLTALYDHSDGFFRRQIILTTKPIENDRVINPFLDREIISTESEGIVQWCIEGLHRLIKGNWKIVLSERTEKNLQEAEREAFNFIAFLEDTNEVEFNRDFVATSNEIWGNYCSWCLDNGLDSSKRRTIIDYLHTNERKYNITYDNHIKTNDGREVRGFVGIRLKRKKSVT